jgi:hypothetical protein
MMHASKQQTGFIPDLARWLVGRVDSHSAPGEG